MHKNVTLSIYAFLGIVVSGIGLWGTYRGIKWLSRSLINWYVPTGRLENKPKSLNENARELMEHMKNPESQFQDRQAKIDDVRKNFKCPNTDEENEEGTPLGDEKVESDEEYQTPNPTNMLDEMEDDD